MRHYARLSFGAALATAFASAACLATTSPPPPAYQSGPVAAASQPAPAQPPPVAQPMPPPPVAQPMPPPPVAQPMPPPPVAQPPVAQPPPPPVRVEERRDDRADRRFDRHSNWDKLGERWVEGRLDRDVIKVGKKKDRYTAVAIVVEHSALEMYDMVIEFGDGTTFSPNLRMVFGADSASRVIDLPGDARNIKKVEFRYGNLPGGGKAQVELWALDARRDAGDGHDGKGKGKGHGRGKGHR
ncbi:MAG: hypothetical protein R3B06_16370 [Kofleriaceae bacterium]